MFLGKKSWLATAAVGSTAVAVTLLGLPSQAAEQATARPGREASGQAAPRTPGYLDARDLGQRAAVRADRQRLNGESRTNATYQKSLGPEAVLDFDPLTGTPRNFARLDGFLTGASSSPARAVALAYVRDHLSTLGLTSADLSTLRFRKDYVDDIGIHHLSWTQYADGVPVFGNGLKVQVTRSGRVLSVQGSPVSGLQKLADSAPAATRVSAAAARSRAASNVGGHASDARVRSSRSGSDAATTWSNHDYAKRVWFLTPAGLRPGWSTYVRAGDGAYQHVVDARTGSVLFRRSTVARAEGDSYVYGYYPGAARGGSPKVVNFLKRGWLGKGATFLNGSSVVAWSDVNDDNAISAGEKTPVPGTKKAAQFTLHHFGTSASSFCKNFVCTWDPNTADSWKRNRRADVAQAFYLASNFHDYLSRAPISFTTRAGNFSAAGGDPVLLNALDGADTNAGLPDGNHIDNANMDTPPDGTPPTMQMYLWHFPGATDDQDPFVPTSSAFDASVEYHEYTHGLSNRLVVDANGNSTLNSIEAGAMGEAWSDYYAMDYLVKKGFVKDTASSGQVKEGTYLTGGAPFRTMAIDCAVGATAKACTDLSGGKGGYTYGDFPNVSGSPEVHSSGEVWAQTLWDLRKALGADLADRLITRAMSISADDPSYLDMRNAIIQADLVAYDGAHRGVLWTTFAHRGMGYFAGAIDGGDTAPAEDFHTPPPPYTQRTSITGTVTDPTTGDPVQGALVKVAGQGDQFADVTGADGSYTISGLYAGTYKKVVASGPGYFPEAKEVDSTSSTPTDFSITRDWAAESGGAEITDFNGPDYTAYGCGPEGAIDLGLSTGWGSSTGNDAADPTNVFVPKHIVVDMHRAVNISTFGVDPTSTCGDAGSASTGSYKIETSTDGTTWITAATGAFTAADRGHLNDVAPLAGAAGVRYVRFTILGNQTPDFATNCPDGQYDGCSFTDLSELAVFGSETP